MANCLRCRKPLPPKSALLLCDKCSKEVETKESSTQSDTPTSFVKKDRGKLEWDLMPFDALEEVVKVLMFGAQKYSKDNWKKCDNFTRYENAAMRHLIAYMKGEKIDPESGENHMAHLICNALYLIWKDKQDIFD